MASAFESFQELNLTRDEVERITDALKDKKFRQLLTEYVDEVRDPENQKLYQSEITELEKERGVDVTFINPVAGYVIKTSLDGSKKAFINVCANEHVEKPSANPGVQEGTKGLKWELPHSLAPPREDMDQKGVRCNVYDVVFHPDTLHLAQRNKAFRDMINYTACDAVESNFDVSLDRKNLKFPKLQYKGFPQPAVIRKASVEKPPELSAEEKEIMDKFYAQAGAGQYPPPKPEDNVKKTRKPRKKGKNENESLYTLPKYIIKHRRHVEMDEFTDHKTSKINAATPKELVVEVNLPLLKSSADIVLDVTEKTLSLTSEKPAKYKLVLTLPYQVNQDSGNAKFDKDQKKLVVTLPVKTNVGVLLTDIAKDDSGIESDHGSLTSTSPIEEINSPIVTGIQEKITTKQKEFLDSNLHYSLPEFTSHIFQSTIAFTLNVKNVDESSIKKIINENATDFHMKFSNVSSGFCPLHYAFYVRIPEHNIDKDKVVIEVWDNNVIVQINYIPCDKIVNKYYFGLSKNDLIETYLEEPSIINEVLEEGQKISCQLVQPQMEEKNGSETFQAAGLLMEAESGEVEKQINREKEEQIKQSKAIDIVGAISESNRDEISFSYSPTKGRGILKGLGDSRRFRRSVSESGLDDVAWTSSNENCHASVDSVIPEEGEMSTSYKKTVRFNNVVSRQLFRSNSSILGQRKKNQRKAKAKKRAQERRHSEGETSENEERRELQTGDDGGNEKGDNNLEVMNGEKHEFPNDIFELDINF